MLYRQLGKDRSESRTANIIGLQDGTRCPQRVANLA